MDMTEGYMDGMDAGRLYGDFIRDWASYKDRPKGQTDQEWLEGLLTERCGGIGEGEAKEMAAGIIASLEAHERAARSLEAAARQGRSKEEWLGEELQRSAIGLSAAQYSGELKRLDSLLYEQNRALAADLSRARDGHISMNPNLDGNIAEEMLGRTAQLQADLQDVPLKVDIRNVNTADSVDVRVTNVGTGRYQNYQMKYGKDARATIRMIEEGGYDNQRLIVPTEQLEEVRAHFQAKGSKKTIRDRIEMDGVEGRAFTKADVQRLRDRAQQSNEAPILDDYYYSTKEYALSVGRNAGAMALQAAAVTTGIDVVMRACQGQEIQPDEVLGTAFRAGADTGVKTAAAGTLCTAVRNGKVSFLPKSTGAGLISGIAFVGVENAKVMLQMAEGEMSTLKGLDQMGKNTVAMFGGLGLTELVKGAVGGLIGGPLGVGASLVTGMVGYAAGSGIGRKVYSVAKKVARTAADLGKKAVEGLKRGARALKEGAKRVLNWLF